VLYELERTYENKRILIISHADPLWLLKLVAEGAERSRVEEFSYPTPGSVFTLDFTPIPHNSNYELDYHLPYIDQVTLVTPTGEPLVRTSEVVDCWVESGSMPFAEHHYPMEHVQEFKKRTPADFISEYIAQTRTWFYYMHVLAVTIFGHRAFNNVVTTGTVLAGDGEKMSKSKGNFTDPMQVVDLYGADALRYYLMSNTVMQAEDMNFRDEELKEVHSRFINILHNTLTFYLMYRDDAPSASSKSSHILDRWILLRLAQVAHSVTTSFNAYDTIRATRPLRDFVTDFSTWYLRRSRDRIKEGGEDAKHALATMRYVLTEFSKLIAPVMPFMAEEIYQEVKTAHDPLSVHLTNWPQMRKPFFFAKDFGVTKEESRILTDMERTRTLASGVLMMRQKENIKVRQPLGTLSIAGTLPGVFVEILKDEVNVKEVRMNEKELLLDTALTKELIAEGDEREKMRAVADARKQLGLEPRDVVDTLWGDGPFSVELSTGTEKFNITRHAS
jgi:isoleucyl-tRNA synthetase